MLVAARVRGFRATNDLNPRAMANLIKFVDDPASPGGRLKMCNPCQNLVC